MLKKALCLFCLFSICILYSVNVIPYNNVEVTYGKKSNCTVKNVKVATFYESASIIKERNYNYYNLIKDTNAKLQFVEEVDGVVSYYYYSKKFKKTQNINGTKVNLHIAVSNDFIKIGTPFIY
ncbi:MAG: hypothetical protein J6R29_00860, partial [Clostridia bacterium]|nr:hypothetical protein [Clostridia bacterium]